MTCRVAAVDCGTNSLRLLLADLDPGCAGLADVVRRMEIVRLGQGVDQTGWLAPDTAELTLALAGRGVRSSVLRLPRRHRSA